MAQPTGAFSSGLTGAEYQPVTVPMATSSVWAATGAGSFLGFTAAEMKGVATSNGGFGTTAATAAFRLHDGAFTGATNCLTSLVTLAAGQSLSDWYGPQGVAVATGVYVEVVSGFAEWTIYGF